MNALEARIPPAVVLLVTGALAYGVEFVAPGWSPIGPGTRRAVGLVVAAVVTGGIYRLTRNPMYLGMALVLVGWCVALGTVPGLVVAVPLLVGCLTRFQIVPEERMLEERFGPAYLEFRDQVRRWV